MQFNFSRIIMTLLKLTPVTEIQIKFGQSCKDDGWILFILSDGGLAGRVGTQRGREKGPSLCCAWTLQSVSCWEKPHGAVSGVTSTGCAQISGTRTILLSSNDPEGEDICNYFAHFPSEGRAHCLQIWAYGRWQKKVSFLLNVGKVFTEDLLNIYGDRYLLSQCVYTAHNSFHNGAVYMLSLLNSGGGKLSLTEVK